MRMVDFRIALMSLATLITFWGMADFTGAQVVPGRYIVVVEPDANPAAVAMDHLLFPGRLYWTALNGFAGQMPEWIVAELEKDDRVLHVEPDRIVHAVGQTLPTGVDRIDVDQNATAKIDGVNDLMDVDIAIIDTGIDKDHPDLNVAGGRRFYTIATGPPWNRGSFEDDNYDDDNGHGSHVAGTAAAIDNGIGVVGVAPGAALWGIKVLDASGSGYLSDVIAGIDWVTDNAGTIEVVNMSLAWQGNSSAARTAIQNSVGAGVVYVVAAGNDSMDVYGADGTFGTNDDIEPASYPEVATISAMADSDGQPGGTGGSTSYGADDSFASFSNYSNSVVAGNPVTSTGAAIDLLLPGVDIYSTYKDGGYATGSGTSMSSPHAAGLAALYIAANSRATKADEVYAIRQALIDGGVAQDSAQGLAVLNDPDSNWENLGWAGPLDVHDVAVTAISAASPVVQGDTATIDVTVANQGSYAETFDVLLMDDTDDVSIGSESVTLAAGASTTVNFSWDTTGATIGDHTLTATAGPVTGETDTADNSKSASVTVESPLTDIAITAVDAPSSEVQGDLVDVNVTVKNVGNQDIASDINVTLTDDTDGATIGTQTISGGLAAGASTTLTYSWDTGIASIGDHTLTASHDFTDDNASNDSKSTTVTVTEAGATMHVCDLDGAKNVKGKSGRWEVLVTVTVHDQSHNSVANATVTGEWSGAMTGTVSGATGSDGTVTFSTGNMSAGTSVTFTVANVSHDTLTYDALSNHDLDGDTNGTTITVSK